jgi:cobalt/nickel transport system permease protein
VVAAPRQAVAVYLVQGLVVAGAAVALGLGLRSLARRLVIEAPFLAFALLLPLVGRGERTDVWFLSLSRPGLWAAWSILAKATLGLAVSVLLTATTPVPALLSGLERLRLPRPLVLIASFMVRYLQVLQEEAARMRIARLSRAQDPGWFWQGRAVAATAGALFVRAYERGERVHLAMLSRGWTGVLAPFDHRRPPASDWAVAISLSVLMWTVTVVAWWGR